MTCKDCIHCDRCKHLISQWGINLDKAINTCDDFKDKSTTLDLPCKVKDKVYSYCKIFNCVLAYEVEDIHIDKKKQVILLRRLIIHQAILVSILMK